ncbi:MAG: hypothetical protein JWP63_2845 [Candidatus Solibacter sp.]|nr:hypothetical protein [Candidatus Solibacter sp.]
MASYIAAEPGVEPRENSECEDEPAERAAPPVDTETDSGEYSAIAVAISKEGRR